MHGRTSPVLELCDLLEEVLDGDHRRRILDGLAGRIDAISYHQGNTFGPLRGGYLTRIINRLKG